MAGASSMCLIANHETNVGLGAMKKELLSRKDVEEEYGLPARWLELAALRGDGPKMLKISARMVKYRRTDLEEWLSSRIVRSTSEQPAGEAA